MEILESRNKQYGFYGTTVGNGVKAVEKEWAAVNSFFNLSLEAICFFIHSSGFSKYFISCWLERMTKVFSMREYSSPKMSTKSSIRSFTILLFLFHFVKDTLNTDSDSDAEWQEWSSRSKPENPASTTHTEHRYSQRLIAPANRTDEIRKPNLNADNRTHD